MVRSEPQRAIEEGIMSSGQQIRMLDVAERICQQRGVRLTLLRRRVLEQVLKTEGVIKAYDLIHELSSQDRRIKPPTIYRSLAFLLGQGFIHRVESLNGFVVCANPGEMHEALLMICEHCGQISDTHAGSSLGSILGILAEGRGFAIASKVIELRGLCGQCRHAGVHLPAAAADDLDGE